jgi:hypothetical protein
MKDVHFITTMPELSGLIINRAPFRDNVINDSSQINPKAK